MAMVHISKTPNNTSDTSKPLRRRRKQPLLALGDRRVGTDFNDASTSKQMLQLSTLDREARQKLFGELRDQLQHFLGQGATDWKEGETCRRFTIFGDCITIANWQNEVLVSGFDIVKTILALYRLDHSGKYPKNKKKFEEGIASDLRNLKMGSDALLEEASSPLLRFLYSISSVRTHKRQKIFKWHAVPFRRLYRDALDKEGYSMTPSPSSSGTEINGTHGEGYSRNITASIPSPSSWGSPSRSEYLLSPYADSCCYYGTGDDSNQSSEFSEFCKLAFVADMLLSRTTS